MVNRITVTCLGYINFMLRCFCPLRLICAFVSFSLMCLAFCLSSLCDSVPLRLTASSSYQRFNQIDISERTVGLDSNLEPFCCHVYLPYFAENIYMKTHGQEWTHKFFFCFKFSSVDQPLDRMNLLIDDILKLLFSYITFFWTKYLLVCYNAWAKYIWTSFSHRH